MKAFENWENPETSSSPDTVTNCTEEWLQYFQNFCMSMPEKCNNWICICEIYLGGSLFAMIVDLGCWHLQQFCKWIKMPASISNDRSALSRDIQWAFFIHCFRVFCKIEPYYFHCMWIHQIVELFQTIYLCSFAHLSSVVVPFPNCFL